MIYYRKMNSRVGETFPLNHKASNSDNSVSICSWFLMINEPLLKFHLKFGRLNVTFSSQSLFHGIARNILSKPKNSILLTPKLEWRKSKRESVLQLSF